MKEASLLRKFITAIILFAVWMVFSGFFDRFYLIIAVLSVFLSLAVIARMRIFGAGDIPTYIKPRAIIYFCWLIKEVIKSGLSVSIKVWQAMPEIMPVLAWIKTAQKTEEGLTLYANSITLTPGTLCINIEGGMMEIHALSQENMESLNRGYMNNKVKDISRDA